MENIQLIHQDKFKSYFYDNVYNLSKTYFLELRKGLHINERVANYLDQTILFLKQRNLYEIKKLNRKDCKKLLKTLKKESGEIILLTLKINYLYYLFFDKKALKSIKKILDNNTNSKTLIFNEKEMIKIALYNKKLYILSKNN